MIAPDAFLAYCITAFALAAVPGPTVTVIIANSLRHGTAAGMANVVGTVGAGLIWVGVAALGLSAAIAVMGFWFDLLRYAGAAYLVWLGYKLLTSRGEAFSAKSAEKSRHGFVAQAFFVTLSNPKILVLFGMIIPPFLSKGGNTTLETTVLGASFVTIACITDCAYAVLAGRAGAWLSHTRVRAIEIISGCFLVGAGLWMGLRGLF